MGIALSSLVACVDSVEEPVDAVELTSARYETTWVLDGVTLRQGGGWTVTADTGTVVTVDTGYLVNYQASLVPCVDLRPSLDEQIGSTSQYAHGDVPDPSATPTPLLEKLANPGATELADITMVADRYCGAHYLIARGNLDTVPLPADVLMIGRTLYLSGSYQQPGEEHATPFVVDTDLAHARLDTLDALDVMGEGNHAEVVIRRDLARMFDGVEFDTGGEQERALQILANITGHARLVVTLF